MLALFRRFLNTWPARLFFLVLVAAFGLWGVADVLRNIGNDRSLATVGGEKIAPQAFQEEYERQMAQVGRMMGGGEPPPEMRRAIGGQVLQRMLVQYALDAEVHRQGLVVPDEALREATFDNPAFQGPDHRFDRARFEQVLRANGLAEPAYLALMRRDLGQQELMEAVRAGVSSPDVLTRAIFAFQQEKRTATLVRLPLAGAPPPPAPSEADLQRWYDNNPDLYRSPEYRRIKAVILSPELLARDMPVTEDELRAAYEQRRGEYNTPEKRWAQVLVAGSEATARKLAADWTAGADWTHMQEEAKQQGASAVVLDEATPRQIPSPDLARAVFAAREGVVEGPFKDALGWQVLRVARVAPAASRSYEQVRGALSGAVQQQKAADAVYDRANKVEDALASGSGLEGLPGDLGLAAVTGTLDVRGDTREGTPAPIPGGPELRASLLQAAFAAHKGEPPKLAEVRGQGGGASSYYAVAVEEIIPPARKPFAAVQAEVREDVLRDARRHAVEERAAQLMAAVTPGTPLSAAAAAAGLQAATTPELPRQLPESGPPPEGVPQELLAPLFRLKRGEATMVETSDGFVVAQLAAVQVPDRDGDPLGYGRTRDALAGLVGNDIELTYALALRERAHPTVNRPMFDSLLGGS